MSNRQYVRRHREGVYSYNSKTITVKTEVEHDWSWDASSTRFNEDKTELRALALAAILNSSNVLRETCADDDIDWATIADKREQIMQLIKEVEQTIKRTKNSGLR